MRALVFLIACACAAPAAAARGDAPAAHRELASFVDMVRLSAAAPLIAEPAAAQAPLRVTFVQPLAAEPRFSIRAVHEPERWVLLFSGLALAGWVAHRRLVSPL